MPSNRLLPSKDLYLATQVSHPTADDILTDCAVCRDTPAQPIKLSCKHIYCAQCIIDVFAVSNLCPLCRAALFKKPDISPAVGTVLPPEITAFWNHKIPWKWFERDIILPIAYDQKAWKGYGPLKEGVDAFASKSLSSLSRPREPNPYELAQVNDEALIARMLGAVFGMACLQEVNLANRGKVRHEWIDVALVLLRALHHLRHRCLRVADLRRYLEGELCLKPSWLHCASADDIDEDSGDETLHEVDIESLTKEEFDLQLRIVVDFVVESAELKYVMVRASECGYSEKEADMIVCDAGFSSAKFRNCFEGSLVKALAAHKGGRLSKEALDRTKRDLLDQFMNERF